MRRFHSAHGIAPPCEVDAERAQPGLVDLELIRGNLPVPDRGLRKLQRRTEFDRQRRGGWRVRGIGAGVHDRLLSPA